MAVTPTLEGLRTCIQALERDPENSHLRGQYTDRLSRLHEAVFHKFSKLLESDLVAKDLDLWLPQQLVAGGFSNYPGARQRLLPLAQACVKAEEQFKRNILTNTAYPFEFPAYYESFEVFHTRFIDEGRVIYKNIPYFFEMNHLVTVRWFEKALNELKAKKITFNSLSENSNALQQIIYKLKELAGKNGQFSTLFEESDPAAFSMLMNWAIITWIKNPQREIPELFVPHTEWFAQIREMHSSLNAKERCALEDTLLGKTKITQIHPAHTTFIEIGKLRSAIETGTRESAATISSLFHTLSIKD